MCNKQGSEVFMFASKAKADRDSPLLGNKKTYSRNTHNSLSPTSLINKYCSNYPFCHEIITSSIYNGKQRSNIITAALSVVIVALQCCQIVNVILMGLLFLLGGVLLFFSPVGDRRILLFHHRQQYQFFL